MSNEPTIQAITSLDPNTLGATDVNHFPQTIGLQYNVPPDDMNFDGSTDAVSMNGTDPVKVVGAFTVVATFKVDLSDQSKPYYYIWSHNNQDEILEKFFRFRQVNGVFRIQFGVWNAYENHMVDIPLPGGIDGKWVTLTGIFNPATAQKTFRLFNGSTLIGTQDDATPRDPGAFDGTWFIGAHAPAIPGKERYFKGILPRVTLFPTALQLWVTLSTDSDNNGYNSSVSKNAPAEFLERSFRNDNIKAKPITFFDEEKKPDGVIVPEVYKRVPLRIFAFTDDIVATQFQFNADVGLQIIDAAGNPIQLDTWLAFSNLNVSTIADNGTITDNYFVQATGDPDPNPIVKEVTLKLKANNNEISDSVKFHVQEAFTIYNNTMYDWIVPSGWRITFTDGKLIFTTIATETGAPGPQIEGSGYKDNNTEKRGYMFSTGTFANGFKFQCKYSFLRNGDAGYVQPDKNRDEIPDDNLKKLSFVGNSGIKLGSFEGAGKGVTEIAILDTKAMVDRVTINDGSSNFSGIEAFKHRPELADDVENYTGVPNAWAKTSKVKFIPEYTSTIKETEYLAQLLNGIGYGVESPDGNSTFIYDYQNATGTTWEKLYKTLELNYNHCYQDDNEIAIYWKPDNGEITGTLEVYLKIGNSWKKYYSKSGIKITGSTGEVDLDGHIYIQTHWGSGVKFENIEISNWVNPPLEN